LLATITIVSSCEHWITKETGVVSVTGPDSARVGEELLLKVVYYLPAASEFSHHAIDEFGLELFVTIWILEDVSSGDRVQGLLHVDLTIPYTPSSTGLHNFRFNPHATDTSFHILKSVVVY
jgi:hypothetical protein